jgi:Asp-tRNA(Asn)/Glu-tRNA(Gln) amidotransferase A subunit family amidase
MGLVGLKRSASGASDESWSSLSTVGILGHTASDVRIALDVLDEGITSERVSSLDGVGFGVPWSVVHAAGLDDDVSRQFGQDVELLRGMGARIASVELPSWAAGASATFVLLYGLQFGRYAQLLGSPPSLLGASVRRRLMAGAFVSTADVARCEKVRRALDRELATSMGAAGVEALVTPVVRAVGPAPDGEGRSSGLAAGVVFTAPVNLVGWPAVSVPGGATTRGAPLGVQLVAPPGRDAWLLDVAALLMNRSGWAIGQCIA